jgi:hypothetical protein
MRNLTDKHRTFLEWIDNEIKACVRFDADTPISWLMEVRLNSWARNVDLEEVLCYEVVEAFLTNDTDEEAMKSIRLFWETKPSDEYIKDLLLIIPIEFIHIMLRLAQT